MDRDTSQKKMARMLDLKGIEIVVKKVKSPANFWAQIVCGEKSDEEFSQLKKSIQEFYNDSTFSKSRLINPSEGKKCIVKSDDRTWHRAVIEQVLVSTSGFIINCNLVDEVEVLCFSARSVYDSPPWVWELPIQSACFGLYGIAPARLRADYLSDTVDVVESRNMKRWDPAATEYFKDICKRHSKLLAHVLEKDEKNVMWVQLFVPGSKKNETMICINDEMLSSKLAMMRCLDHKTQHDSSSIASSEESGNEGRYLSPMQLRAQREKLEQLLKQNVRTLLSEFSSDESDDLKLSDEADPSRHKDEYPAHVSLTREIRCSNQAEQWNDATHSAKDYNDIQAKDSQKATALKNPLTDRNAGPMKSGSWMNGLVDKKLHGSRSACVSGLSETTHMKNVSGDWALKKVKGGHYRHMISVAAVSSKLQDGNAGRQCSSADGSDFCSESLPTSPWPLNPVAADLIVTSSGEVCRMSPEIHKTRVSMQLPPKSGFGHTVPNDGPAPAYFQAFRITINTKGKAVRSVAMQTGSMESVMEGAEKTREAGIMVNMDDSDCMEQPAISVDDSEKFSVSKQCDTKSLKLKASLSSEFLVEDKFGLKFGFDSGSASRSASEVSLPRLNGANLKHVRTENDFYSKAPRVMITAEVATTEEKIQLDCQESADIAIPDTEEKQEPHIQTVFVPDNLHSGSVILIRGKSPPNPISLFCKSPFPQHMKALLEEFRYKGPLLIQAYAWPAILSGRDVLALAPRGGGKTISYAVPIAAMLIKNSFRAADDSKQPLAVIVTTNWTDAQNIHQLLQELLAEYAGAHNIITVYGGSPSEDSKASEIASGCSILICTAPSLVRVHEAKYMNFSKIKHLILDDINILAEEFTGELKDIMRFRANTLMASAADMKPHKPSQIICVGSQWTAGVQSYFERFLTNQPLLLISHPLEAAVYGNVQHKVITCHQSHCIGHIVNLLHHWEENKHGGIAIFVNTVEDANQLHEIIKAQGFYCEKAHGNMCQGELDNLRRQFEDDTCKPVLVATDDVILELDVYCVQTAIHMSLPSDQHSLGVRLSTMQSFFHPKGREKNGQQALSYFLVTKHDAPLLPDLVKFLKRVNQPVSDDLAKLSTNCTEAKRREKNVTPLCPVLNSFGRCRNQSVCPFRHWVSAMDQPNVDPRFVQIPVSGHVRLLITHVENATQYYGRLEALRSESSKTVVKYDATHARITMDLAIHFGCNDCTYLEEDPVLGKVYALAKSFQRVCVVPITNSHVLEKKYVQEWSGTKNQAMGKRFICWTTPGGVRKACVRLVDSGPLRVVRCDELVEIPKELADVPFQAIVVKACKVKPVDKDTKWLTRANEFVHEHLHNKVIEGNIVKALGHTIWLHPVVIRSKLTLTNRTVTDFNVVNELIKMKFAEKNPDHLELLGYLGCNEARQSMKGVRSRSSTCSDVEKVATRDNSKIFASCIALTGKAACAKESAMLDCVTSDASELKPVANDNAPCCRKGLISTLAPALDENKAEIVEKCGSKLESVEKGGSKPEIDGKGGAVMHDLVVADGVPAQTSCTSSVHEADMKEVSEEVISEWDISDSNEESLHLLGSLCDKFVRSTGTASGVKIANEIHMKSVGCPHDLTEKDMIGLAKIFQAAMTTQEKRTINAALFALTEDKVPVARYIKMRQLVNSACSFPVAQLKNETKESYLVKEMFELCQALLDSFFNNDRVKEDGPRLDDINEMIFSIERYLRYNIGRSDKVFKNAAVTLHMLREYRHKVKKEQEVSDKKNNNKIQTNAVSVKKPVKDMLNYDRFNCIDTDTETDTIRPYTPVGCQFGTATEASTAETESDTQDGFYGL